MSWICFLSVQVLYKPFWWTISHGNTLAFSSYQEQCPPSSECVPWIMLAHIQTRLHHAYMQSFSRGYNSVECKIGSGSLVNHTLPTEKANLIPLLKITKS